MGRLMQRVHAEGSPGQNSRPTAHATGLRSITSCHFSDQGVANFLSELKPAQTGSARITQVLPDHPQSIERFLQFTTQYAPGCEISPKLSSLSGAARHASPLYEINPAVFRTGQ
jgi:hypothetical protein